jgi:hypothetical protein
MTLFAPQDRAWGDSENSSSNNIGRQQQEQKKNDCFDTSFSSSSIVEPSQRRNDDECCYNDDKSSGGGGGGGCDDVIGKAHTATHTTQGEFTATVIPSEIQCKVLSSSSGGGGSNSAAAAAAASSVNSVCGFGSENGFSNLSSLYTDGRHQQEQEQLSLQQQRIVNKNICTKLLRSGWYDDNCLGIERLMAISNYELVNTQFDENSIAYAFTSRTKNKNNNKRSNDDDDDDKFSKWLRNLFLSFFCDQQQHHHHQRSNRTKTINKSDKKEVDVYGFSDPTEAHHHHHQQKRTRLLSLKVPALRILISSLELISRTQQQQQTKTKSSSSSSTLSLSSSSSIDILGKFWKAMLAYMTECLQELVLHDDEQQPGSTGTKSTSNTSTSTSTISNDIIEASLVVKGIRLLQIIEPTMMRPYVRYSLLPYISNAKEIFDGQQSTSTTCCMGDKILVRECERLLKEATTF